METNKDVRGITEQLKSILNVGEDWRLPPISTGTWKKLDASNAVRILVRLTAEQTARKEPIIPLDYKVLSVRATPLVCYPGCLLIEALCAVPFSIKPAICTLFFAPEFIRPTDFTSPFIHFELNEHGLLSIKNNEEALAYLRFFCGMVVGDEGRFIIVESEQQIDQAVFDLSRSPEYTKIQLDKEDDYYKANCTILYGDSLFSAEFKIDENGSIEMVDDKPIANDLQVVQEKFHGYFRYVV